MESFLLKNNSFIFCGFVLKYAYKSIITDLLGFLKSCFLFFCKKVGLILQISGIVCEYNPFHLGHKKQIDYLHSLGHAVVCVMSGNFVQRGHPAIFDKMTRAEAALACGADLVIELPLPYAISSAENFAAGGVQILNKLCDHICFGAETADSKQLMATANALLSYDFKEKLRLRLDEGLSFPVARACALTDLGYDAEILATPNNILAVEYCKAILTQSSQLTPIIIHRQGSYHAAEPDAENPSATSLRALIEEQVPWQNFVPKEVTGIFDSVPIHTLLLGKNAILYRLRTMTDADFEALPFGSEGLWRKLMHASRSFADLESIITATKSKRYTRTRIDRMILCAYLGITEKILHTPAPYARVLAFNDTGRTILHKVKKEGYFVNIGERTGNEFEMLEHRADALYGLFTAQPELANVESNYRPIYRK